MQVVTVRMVPAPRGAGIVVARVPKKVLQLAGIEDVFTSSRWSTKTLGNFVKATFECLMKTHGFLTPDFWRETRFSRSPFQEYTDLSAKPTKPCFLLRIHKKFISTKCLAEEFIAQVSVLVSFPLPSSLDCSELAVFGTKGSHRGVQFNV
ncbi:Ribosomal protein S5, C-terminal [Dillenia turbinata]|uniref:Ribosomal protein S5, C-terminal n=1 Tax=Dillenia turbinata TaxID=194707 RepID=A0AAN8VW37_9MAGN